MMAFQNSINLGTSDFPYLRVNLIANHKHHTQNAKTNWVLTPFKDLVLVFLGVLIPFR